MNFRKALLILQMYVHVFFFAGLFFIPLSQALVFIVLSQIIYVGFCGTGFYHRTVAHRNEIYPFFDTLFLMLSWVGISGSAIAWAGTHRKHHRFSDTDRDPHSPIRGSKLKAYWYSSGSEDVVKYVPDLLRKKHYLFQHKHYFKVLLGLHALGALFLPIAWYWGLLITPAFTMWFAGSSINAFCHDQKGPINVPILGWLHAGEGFHQNHHNEPKNSSFRHWGDWGYYLHVLVRKPKNATKN
jgi:fatty-acid desaturase